MSDGFKLVGGVGGFPEYLPAQQRAVQAMMRRVSAVFERFGYTPLETAAVEKVDTLLAKGIDAKEVYGLRRLAAEDGGDKDLALRFDLTVPTARYVVQNRNELVFPFRRYQMQPVWRGERQQKGRYRQFYQCDIDVIGDGSLPLVADAEIIACAVRALDALEVGEFTVRVNNRKLLEGIIRYAGAKDPKEVLKKIDQLEKIGHEALLATLIAASLFQNKESAADLLEWLGQPFESMSIKDSLDEEGLQGANEIHTVFQLAREMLPPRLEIAYK